MSKYQIEVAIPDGDYCTNTDKNKQVFCEYLGAAHYGGGYCAFVVDNDSIVHWDDEDKPLTERTFLHIVKHKKCPSLQKRRR